MSSKSIIPDTIEVPTSSDIEHGVQIEHHLQEVYGSGTYISDFYVSENNTASISIGNTFPKDVSDCRPRSDRVIKYIALDDIADLSAEYRDGEYLIELKSRSEVASGLKSKKKELRNNLDQALAKATYKRIAGTPAVENQLNPIKQILRWTRLHDEPEFEEVKRAQDKNDDKTLKYVKTLEELGFIRLKNGILYPEDPLEKYDLGDVKDEEFNETILGEVIDRGFKRLSKDLNLRILLHLPKFANGYYLDAIEREDPDLHLDMDRIQENMIDWYGYSASVHRFELQDKLNQLVSLEILEKDNEYFTAKGDIYNQMRSFSRI